MERFKKFCGIFFALFITLFSLDSFAATVKMTLDPNGGSGGTTEIYYKAGSGYFKDAAATQQISLTSAINRTNNITPPTRTGYTFDGYYGTTTLGSEPEIIDKDGFVKSGTYNISFANNTLKAKWTPKEFTVTFKSGNTTLGTQTFTYDTPKNLTSVTNLSGIPVSSEHGWAFVGWAAFANTTTVAHTDGKSMSISANTILYGVWKRIVTFTYYDGANATSTTTNTRDQYYYNTSTTAAEAGRVSTYALTEEHDNGWIAQEWAPTKTGAYLNPLAPVVKNVALAIDAPYQYYAVYNRDVRLVYNGNGSTSGTTANTTKTQSFRAGNTDADALTMTLASNGFSRPGYDFNKWAAGSTSGTQYAAGASYTFPNTKWTSGNTANMYATWTAKCNKITLNLNNGTGGTTVLYKKTGDVSYYSDSNCSTLVTSITIPKKNGSVFQGYTNASGAACSNSAGQFPTSSDPCPVTGDTAWNAQYAACAWTAGANSMIVAASTNSSNQCSYTVTCSTGYSRYGGVNTASEFEYDGGAAIATGNLPECLPRIYTIALRNYNDSSTHSTIYEKYENGWYSNSGATTTLSKASAPTRDGYKLRGFYTEKQTDLTASGGSGTRHISADGTLPANTTFTANTNLYAAWAKNCTKPTNGTCSLTINSDGTATYSASCNAGYSVSNATTATPSCSAKCNRIGLNPNGGTAGSVTELYKLTGSTAWYENEYCEDTISGLSGDELPTKANATFNGYFE